MSKTHRNVKGWSKDKPGYKQRTIMLKKCGKTCFLGTKKSFPICSKNTCKINKKGVMAAYMRAREYETIIKHKKIKTNNNYRRISNKAHKILYFK
jgi:hypothetical protein